MTTQIQLNRMNHRGRVRRTHLVASLLALGAMGVGLSPVLAGEGPGKGQTCPADLNADGVVDATDLGILLNNFGCVGADCPADISADGVVDATDLGILLNNFGCAGKIAPAYNRGIESLEFSPGSEPGLWNVTATWYVETNETDSFRDLSALVVASVNGDEVNTVLETATINAAAGACLGSLPPCNGLPCGTWTIGPLTLNGVCVKSIASIVGIEFCTCACVVFSVALEDYPLVDGDQVSVHLVPVPGSLPEIITGDDAIDVVFVGAGGTGACCLEPFGSGCIDGVSADTCAEFPNATFFPGATCAGIGCGPGVGPCCEPQPGPGCGDPDCQAQVCLLDPFCCDVVWDQLCADLANEICAVCAPDQVFHFEFEYNGKAQLVVPDVNDLPFLDFMFTLIDDPTLGPVTIIPVDALGVPLAGNEAGIQIQPGGSFVISEPDAGGYLLIPASIPGAIGAIEVRNFQLQATNTVKRVCDEAVDIIAIQSVNPAGAFPKSLTGTFSVPANTNENTYCPIRVTIVVQEFDFNQNIWVPSGPQEQPVSPVTINPGGAQSIPVTILSGRRVLFSTRCLESAFNSKCEFTFTSANN